MNLIGIDIGSDSVRVSVHNRQTGQVSDYERPLERRQNGPRHTMSGQALWAQILLVVAEHDAALAASLIPHEAGPAESAVWASMERGPSATLLSGPILPKEPREGREAASGSPAESWGQVDQGAPPLSQPGGRATLQPCTATEAEPVPSSAVCVAATCSMVVMERVRAAPGTAPCGAYFRPAQVDEEVIVWMDTRARAQALWAARMLPAAALAQIGGTVTPEMGVAKLKWVSDTLQTPDNEVCVFELHDWVAYVFLAGGYRADGHVRCLANDAPEYAPGLTAMDGSVKGWGRDLLERLEIRAQVCCAPSTRADTHAYPHVGTPLGSHGSLLVAHGCIDCYAGWAGQAATAACAAGPAAAPTLLMVAGTLTCFVALVALACAPAVPGLWGPFSQLLAGPVYSFGQPATGQLFAELFAQHAALIGASAPFAFVEQHARAMEREHGHSLTVLARHYLYYGDKHGNRSPYGDFRMGEVFVDGHNASASYGSDSNGSDTLAISTEETSVRLLVLRYYLTLEFLVLQTKQLCEKLARACGPVGTVYLSGSQAHNARLVLMLSQFAFAGTRVLVLRGDSKYAGSRGIALLMLPHLPGPAPGALAANAAPRGSWVEPVVGAQGPREARVLSAKFRAFQDLAQWQRLFHDAMNGV